LVVRIIRRKVAGVHPAKIVSSSHPLAGCAPF
jgi:hypothetical protein